MTFVFLDYETRCLLDLPTVGTDRYMEKAEILMVGVIDEEREGILPSLDGYAGCTFVSWGDFDRHIAERVDGIFAPNWINAANLARMVGLPGGLQKFCSSIGIPAKKDARGTRLINRYSKPQKDGTFLVLEGEDRQAFEDYCLQDVRLLQQAFRFLAPLVPEWQRCHSRSAETYDKMNARGVPIDVEAAKLALDACTQQAEEIEIACRYKHGFSITQVEKVREFLGTKDCIRQTLESFKTKDPDKIWLRDARLLVSKAATKKLVPMIDMASDDGRVRGAFQYHGAHTGRGSSHGVQFQNLKKAKIDPSYFDRLHSNVFMEDPTGECQRNIRGFIKAPVDHTFVIVDYAQVEARIVAWIANERPLVEAFVEGRDIYKEFAARVYGVTIDTVTDSQRAHGKAAILGCFAPDTLVLTDCGWKPILTVSTSDRLWDGEEWVWHKGVVHRGEREVLNQAGVRATPEHPVWIGDRWSLWSEVCGNPLIRQLALDSASLPSSVGSERSSAVDRSGGQCAAAPVAGRASSAETICAPADQPAVESARGAKRVYPSRRSIGGITISAPMRRLVRAFSTAYRLAQTGVTILTTQVMRATAAAVSMFSPLGGILGSGLQAGSAVRGLSVEPASLPICLRYPGTTTPRSSLIGSTTIGGMSPATLGSPPGRPTSATAGRSGSYSVGSKSLSKRTRVFDIAYAGPRNRYTILTDAGPMVVHNCGYGMGPDRFVVQAGQQGIDVPFQTAQKLVGLYRSAYAAIPLLWNEIDTGIKRLLWGHNDVFSAGRCTFTVNKHRTMLRVELPSQRVLRYFMPKVEDNQIVYQGRFGPTHCWGGHFVENICQAIAGDLKVDAMQRADKLGYRTVMEVHDELVIEEANEICASTLNMMLMVMADPPEWMDEPGLIKGEGKLSDRFTK